METNGKKQSIGSRLLGALELVSVSAFLLGLAVYGRHHWVDGNPRQDALKLLFFICLFGGACIIEARLYALLQKRPVFGDAEKGLFKKSLFSKFYIAGYVALVLSTILGAIIITLYGK